MEVEFHEIIISVLAVAFGAWAGVIVWIGNGIRADLKEESRKLNKYIAHTEGRLGALEAHVGLNNRGETL